MCNQRRKQLGGDVNSSPPLLCGCNLSQPRAADYTVSSHRINISMGFMNTLKEFHSNSAETHGTEHARE